VSYTALISPAISILAVIVVYFAFIIHIREDIERLNERCANREKACGPALACLPEIRAQIAMLTKAQEVSWAVIAPHLANIIHSPVHKDRDSLVDGLIASRLNEDELLALRCELRLMLDSPESAGEKRLAGALILGRVEQELAICYARRKGGIA
jgi:hypothetical protein